MLKGITNLIWGYAKADSDVSSLRGIPEKTKSDLQLFYDTLNILDSADEQAEKVQLLGQLVRTFDSTFANVHIEHAKHNFIRKCLERYLQLCGRLGNLLMLDDELCNSMFVSLETAHFILGSRLPDPASFTQFFTEIVKSVETNSSILDSSIRFISVLFRSREFFQSFVKIDGFSLVFNAFFLQRETTHTATILQLLFGIVPPEYYDMEIHTSLTELLLTGLTCSDLPSIALFTGNYIGSWFKHNPIVLRSFQEKGGFMKLNEFMRQHCDDNTIVECYGILLKKTYFEAAVVQSMYSLYMNTGLRVATRTSILKTVAKCVKNADDFEKFNSHVMILLWVKDSGEMDREGYGTMTEILFRGIEQGKISAADCLECLTLTIEPPMDEQKPVEEVLVFIYSAMTAGMLSARDMIKQKFFDRFIIDTDKEEQSKYLEFGIMRRVIQYAYQQNDATNKRIPILHAVFEAFKPDLEDLLVALLRIDFSSEALGVALRHIRNSDVTEIIIKEIERNSNSFDLFKNCLGFTTLKEYLHAGESIMVLRVLEALVHFGPHDEIDDFVTGLSHESALFKLDRKLLGRLISKIGAFLPFCDELDITSPIIVRNAGRCGIPLCKRLNISPIPYLNEIANVHCSTELMKLLLEDVENIHKNVDMDMFPQQNVIEFRPDGDCAYLEVSLDEEIRSISFSIFEQKKSDCIVLRLGSAIITAKDGALEVTINEKSGKLDINLGWNSCCVTIQNKIFTLSVNNRNLTIPMNESNITTALFGDKTRKLGSKLVISTLIIPNNGHRFDYVSGGSVYRVVFRGFATFFDGIWSVETLFNKLDTCSTVDEFTSIYITLINLHGINGYDDVYFWQRLLISVKNQARLVEPNIIMLLHQVPSNYAFDKWCRFVEHVLKDIELYYCFDPSSMCTYLGLIESDIDETVIENFNTEMPILLMHIMRTGVDVNVCFSLLKIVEKMMSLRTTEAQYKQFVNIARSINDWGLKKQSSMTDIMDMDSTESDLQAKVLDVAVKFMKLYHPFALSDLAYASMQFDDERAVKWLQMIAQCSLQDRNFIRDICCIRTAFSRFFRSRDCWNLAFSIWNAQPWTETVTSISIQREMFTGVIMEMLISLAREQANMALKGENPDQAKLLSWVINLMIDIPEEQKTVFTRGEFIAYILLLSNMGMVPESIALDTAQDRRVRMWWNDVDYVTLTNDEFLQMKEGTELSKEAEFTEARMKCLKYEEFPFDHDDTAWIEKLPIDDIVTFITHVVVAVDPHQFDNTVMQVMSGHDLMYESFRHVMTERLGFALMFYFTQNEIRGKNPLRVITRCAKGSIFAHNYIQLVSLVMSYMKRNFDAKYVAEYREILILAFHFLTPDEIGDFFNAIYLFKEAVFRPEVLNDRDFSHFMLYNIGKMASTDEVSNKCLAIFHDHAKRDFINTYRTEETQTKWKAFIDSLSTDVVAKFRASYATILIERTKNSIVMSSRAALASKATRLANARNCAHIQKKEVNSWMRKYESFYFKHQQINMISCCQNMVPKSYHLCHVALPYRVPRAVSPSPFEIHSPNAKVRRSGSVDRFRRSFSAAKSRIQQLNVEGEMKTIPEWFYFHKDVDSPFSYSIVLDYPKINLLADFQEVYGTYDKILSVSLYNYVNPIPCVLFYSQHKITLLVLAEYEGETLSLIPEPSAPVAFLPFTESVALCEWHNTSLFCGHIVLSFTSDRLLLAKPYLYAHKKRAVVFHYLFDPSFVLVYKNESDYDKMRTILRQKPQLQSQLSSHKFLFSYEKPEKAQKAWTKRRISTYDYLLILNGFGGRSISDLSQYPVFPWVVSPSLMARDMSLPMGQLDQKRAQRYEETYHDSVPQYYYGCHYSLPGAVFWFMMRLPPFCYFMWDLNEGWDDSQRMFSSVIDAYESASSSNQTDLKEPVPQLYSVPEMFINKSRLDTSDVVLPKWAMNSPHLFVAVMRKALEESETVQEWIDLIFGFKQTGQAAIAAKNVFLPSSYHGSTADELGLDENVFEDQVINFGQCPIQIFDTPHPQRARFDKHSGIVMIDANMTVKPATVKNPWGLRHGVISKECRVIPKRAAPIGPSFDYFIFSDDGKFIVTKLNTYECVFESKSYNSSQLRTMCVSDDALFIIGYFENGKVTVFQLIHDEQTPYSISHVHQFSTYESCECTSISILSNDYLFAAVFGKKILVFNFATKLLHRQIDLQEVPIGISYDDFEGNLTVVYKHKIEQYSINGVKLHEISVDSEIKCFTIIGYEFRFDARVIVIGDVDGFLSFYVVTEPFTFRKLCCREVFTVSFDSMFYDTYSWKLWLYSSNGDGACVDIGEIHRSGVLQTCKYCGSPMATYCQRCQSPLCTNCVSEGDSLCQTCIDHMHIVTSFDY